MMSFNPIGITLQRAGSLSGRTPVVGRGGLCQRVGLVEGIEGPHAGVDGLGAGDDRRQQFHR